jgi:hypothetical protein
VSSGFGLFEDFLRAADFEDFFFELDVEDFLVTHDG